MNQYLPGFFVMEEFFELHRDDEGKHLDRPWYPVKGTDQL